MKNTIMKQKSTVIEEIGTSFAYTLFFASHREGKGCYGVSVQNLTTGESSMVQDITCNSVSAELLYDSLVKGKVTPVCLGEIVEDFIAEN